VNSKDVRATQPFSLYYGDLIEYLARSHKVVPFAFDWRLQMEKEADRLAIDIRREFEMAKQHNKPVRILAHSMGGLVARAMIARHESLWREVCSIPGARLAMLGTPNRGSHAINELLVAQSSILRLIAFLDLRHSKKSCWKSSPVFRDYWVCFPKTIARTISPLLPGKTTMMRTEKTGLCHWTRISGMPLS
jgi:pimeloyl-ACP methyl ester carboxylesterase